jgi:hypothetical protein
VTLVDHLYDIHLQRAAAQGYIEGDLPMKNGGFPPSNW